MAKLSSYELLSRVWSECTFDEILEFGLSNEYIGSESIINAASEYSDPNKEYSDDELKEIILQNADLSLLLDIIDEKYSVRDIIDGLDQDDVLNCFDADDLIDFCEYDLQDKYNEERNAGYEEGYDDACKDCETEENNILRDGNSDEKWTFLCDKFDVSYYDENLLKQKLNAMFKNFNKTIYKKTKDIWMIKE